MLQQVNFSAPPIVDQKWQIRVGRAVRIALLMALCAVMSWTACSSNRNAQNQSFDLSGSALAEFTSLEPIDAHTHISQTGPPFISMLERLHMHVLDILYVDDSDPGRSSLEQQKQDALKFIVSSKGHGQLCTTFDPFLINNPDFSKNAIATLNDDFAKGAVAAKIWKNIGMEIKDSSGRYVMPDDPRLAPIYEFLAAQHKTLISHSAAPDAAWEARDSSSPYAEYVKNHPQWDMLKKPGAPSKQQILDARDHLLATNPNLHVIGAHFGSLEDHLDDLATRLDIYPNFAVDTAARVPSLVRQPRDQVRAFILRYQDRILYGTDLRFDGGGTAESAAHAWETTYALDWRYFATDDTFDYRGHTVEGLNLPPSVLRKLYHDNAIRWIPKIEATPQ